MICTDHRYRRTRVPDTLIAITTPQVLVICLVVIAYQRGHMVNEYCARDATATRDD